MVSPAAAEQHGLPREEAIICFTKLTPFVATESDSNA